MCSSQLYLSKLSTLRIVNILNILNYFFEFLPFILCSIFYKKILATKEGKAFFIYVLIYAAILFLVLVCLYVFDNRLIMSHLRRAAIIMEFALLCYYYKQVLLSKKTKILFFFAIPLFIILAFYDYYVSTERVISFMPLVIECLFFILLIIYFFYEKIQYSLSTPIYLTMSFWISTGFLIYFSGNFFLFLYSKNAIKNATFIVQYNTIYAFFTINKNILLCIGILMHSRRKLTNNNISLESDLSESLDSFKVYNKQN